MHADRPGTVALPRWTTPLVAVIGALAVLALAFGGHLDGDFVWDDRSYILESARVRSPHGWRALLTEPFALGGSAYRPLSTITFWMQMQAFGPSIVGLRVVNALLHGATGLLFMLWLRKLGIRDGIAVITGWAMLAHPLSTEPVMFANARHDLLGAMCALGALIAWPTAGTGARRFVLATVLVAASVCCKESFVVVPLLCALEALRTRPRAVSRALALLPVLAPVAVVLAFFAWRVVLGISSSSDQLGASALANLVHLGTLVLHYGELVVTFQNGLTVERYAPSPVVIAIGVLVITGSIGVASIIAAKRGAAQGIAAAFGMLWFVLGLLPDVLAVPVLGQYANRYAYFPMLGVFTMLGAGLESISGQLQPSHRKLLAVAGVLAILGVSLGTSLEAFAWRTSLTLFGRDMERAPLDSRVLYHFGVSVQRREGCAAAQPLFERSAAIEPGYDRAWHNVSGCFVELGRFDDAERAATRALEIAPRDAGAMHNLGVAQVASGELEAGIATLERAVEIAPEDHATREALEAARALR